MPSNANNGLEAKNDRAKIRHNLLLITWMRVQAKNGAVTLAYLSSLAAVLANIFSVCNWEFSVNQGKLREGEGKLRCTEEVYGREGWM
jgi:hypothetical protein